MVRKTQEPEGDHRSQDHTSRFALDVMIREAGFQIHSRKKGQPVVWESVSGHILFEQNDLVKQLNWHGVRDALYEQDLYAEGLE